MGRWVNGLTGGKCVKGRGNFRNSFKKIPVFFLKILRRYLFFNQAKFSRGGQEYFKGGGYGY